MASNGTNGANGKTNHSHADWSSNARWAGITRPYSYDDVLRLRGTIQIEYTLARLGAERLWNLMHSEAYVPALGAITGNQAIEMVQAGLTAIYGSGWQVAADGNTAGDVYPDQSLYPCDSAPNLVKRINRALLRADQIESAERSLEWNVLVCAHRGGRGSWLRRFAERVRTDEIDDRSRSGGRPL